MALALSLEISLFKKKKKNNFCFQKSGSETNINAYLSPGSEWMIPNHSEI